MRVLQALLASLLLHLFLMLFIEKLPNSFAEKKAVVEFDVIPEKMSQNETPKFVKQPIVPDKMKLQEAEDKLKFLSEKLQRVKEQTRAAQNGASENRQQKAQLKPQSQPQTQSRNEIDAFSDDLKKNPLRNAQNDLNPGVSTLAESVDDNIKVGDITALNTDRYLFYSFFSRVEDLIYFRWSQMIRESESNVAARMKNSTSNDKWISLVEIWLTSDGHFHSAHLMKSSGIREFDLAATQAFQQARYFPNPPKELVESDGLIHLKYNLTVYFDPKVLVNR